MNDEDAEMDQRAGSSQARHGLLSRLRTLEVKGYLNPSRFGNAVMIRRMHGAEIGNNSFP
jgi:hypothetical protein